MSKLLKLDTDERWKHIEGMSLGYEISSYGNVRENFGDHYEEKKLATSKQGYKLLYLNGNTYRVHMLVAKAFIDNPEGKTLIRHLDGDRSNNHVSNLQWISPSENIQYLTRIGLNGEAIRCKDDGVMFATINSASAYYMISAELIRKSLKTGNTCFGYTFEYLDRSNVNESDLVYLSGGDLEQLSKALSSPEEVREYVNSTLMKKS